jgi:hypothetical protein
MSFPNIKLSHPGRKISSEEENVISEKKHVISIQKHVISKQNVISDRTGTYTHELRQHPQHPRQGSGSIATFFFTDIRHSCFFTRSEAKCLIVAYRRRPCHAKKKH